MEKKDMLAETYGETKVKTPKTEAEKNAKMDDLLAKSKKGKLSESDLDEALEEMDYDIDSLDKLYESLEDSGIPLPELSGSHLMSKAVISPISARMANHARVNSKSPWTYLIVENNMFSELSNPNLYKDTTNPENKPINMASMISLM